MAYAIGVAEPVSLMVNTYGTGTVDEDTIVKGVRELWGLKPAEIISYYDLLKPKYRQTSTYGHFGREEAEFTWEKTEKAEALKDFVKTMK